MTFILELPTIVMLFVAVFSATLALSVYWIVERFLSNGTSDQVFYWKLGGSRYASA